MKTKLITIILFLVSTGLLAQGKGEIRGRVLDSKSGESLPGANAVIKIGNNIVGTQTDLEGNFLLKPLDAGVYDVTISYTGYKSTVVEGIRVDPGKITKLEDVILTYGVDLNGKVAEVIEWVNPIIRVDPLEIITNEETKNMPGRNNFENIVAAMTSQAMVSDNGDIYFRGSRKDNMAVIVDGVKQPDGKMNIPSCAIGSIIVYTGGVPAAYGDFTGGCIVIESQSYFDWLAAQRKRESKRKGS